MTTNPSRDELLRAPLQAPRDDYEATATPLEVDPAAAKAAGERTQRDYERAQDLQERERAALREGAQREQAANVRVRPLTGAERVAEFTRGVGIGRIVRFYSVREGECGGVAAPDLGVPAMVTAVQSNGRLNLTVFGDGIAPHPYSGVPHFVEREGDGVPVRWWVWPDQAEEIAESQRAARKEAESASGRLFLKPRRDV